MRGSETTATLPFVREACCLQGSEVIWTILRRIPSLNHHLAFKKLGALPAIRRRKCAMTEPPRAPAPREAAD